MNLPHLELRKQLTWEHIEKGTRDCCKECPIALALTEILNPRYEMIVGTTYTELVPKGRKAINNNTNIRFYHHEDIEFWIDDFDADEGNDPYPFTIIIDRYAKEIRMEECDS